MARPSYRKRAALGAETFEIVVKGRLSPTLVAAIDGFEVSRCDQRRAQSSLDHNFEGLSTQCSSLPIRRPGHAMHSPRGCAHSSSPQSMPRDRACATSILGEPGSDVVIPRG